MKLTFQNFRIKEIFAKDNREIQASPEKSGVMEVAPEISFGCLVEQDSEPFHALVNVKINVSLQKSKKSSKSLPLTTAFIEGEAKFEITGISQSEYHKLFDNEIILDRMAEQVYPLATMRLVRLLSEMGFRLDVSLSLPEVESRMKLGEMLENEDLIQTIAPKRKPRSIKQ